jgi:glutamyl-tRNA synthetase
MGFLPEAMRNYLLRLGWSHGDEEIIPTQKAIEWFSNFETIGRSPARFDMDKLTHLNGHYMRLRPNGDLVQLIEPFLGAVPFVVKKRIEQGMDGLKERAKTLLDLAYGAQVYVDVQHDDNKAKTFITDENREMIRHIINGLNNQSLFVHDALQDMLKQLAKDLGRKMGDLAQPVRVALTGRTVSPSIFDVMEVLGKDETLKRLEGF